MEYSRFFRDYFQYSIVSMEENPELLTLVRMVKGKPKEIARNFDIDEYIKQKAYGHKQGESR